MNSEQDKTAPEKTVDEGQDAPAADATPPPAPEAAPPAGAAAVSGGWQPVTALVLAGIAVLVSAGAIYLSQEIGRTESGAKERTEDQLAALQQAVSGDLTALQQAHTDDLDSVRQQTGRLTDELTEQQRLVDELRQAHDSFSSALESLAEDRAPADLDWTLQEVEQLLVIASHKLALEADVATALAALQAADRRLRPLADQGVLALRRQLAADMNALRSVDAPDISGMALYLADMVSRTEDLPLRETDTVSIAGNGESDTGAQELPAWRRFLHTVWQELKGLIVISTSSTDATFSLLPEQRYFLRQNLGLQLQAARLSLLQRDTENFRESLSLIDEWLRTYFKLSDPAVANIMESLEMMAGIELQPELPGIESSLDSARSLIRKRSGPGEQSG